MFTRSSSFGLPVVRASSAGGSVYARHGREMETVPAIFTGTVFGLFGSGLLLWTGVRVRHGEAVAHGVHPTISVAVATLVGAGALVLAAWSFGRL